MSWIFPTIHLLFCIDGPLKGYFMSISSLLSSPAEEKIERVWQQKMDFEWPHVPAQELEAKAPFPLTISVLTQVSIAIIKGIYYPSACTTDLKGHKSLPHYPNISTSWEYPTSLQLISLLSQHTGDCLNKRYTFQVQNVHVDFLYILISGFGILTLGFLFTLL